jgi:hypothetical protein
MSIHITITHNLFQNKIQEYKTDAPAGTWPSNTSHQHTTFIRVGVCSVCRVCVCVCVCVYVRVYVRVYCVCSFFLIYLLACSIIFVSNTTCYIHLVFTFVVPSLLFVLVFVCSSVFSLLLVTVLLNVLIGFVCSFLWFYLSVSWILQMPYSVFW